MQTFDILADSKLTDLIECISCVSENVLPEMHREQPFSPPSGKKIRSVPNSGFLLIERTFYYDAREAGSKDLSAPIRSWIDADQFRKSFLGEHEGKSVQNVTWSEVSFQLNKPYQYVHNTACEHYILIEHLRLEHPFDHCPHSFWSTLPALQQQQQQQLLPPVREVFHARRRRRWCNICELRKATCITMDDRLSKENPCFYCQECFQALHQNAKDEWLYNDFKLYPYYHDL